MPTPAETTWKGLLAEFAIRLAMYCCIGGAVMVGMEAVNWLIPSPPQVIEVRIHG